ncbi:hypothetical protein C5614_08445 [Massilia phosphatilytica]|nr:hypothetical protein C5614_08445 [Massilia phosphatilytica]
MKMAIRFFYSGTLAFVIGASLLYIFSFDGKVAVARSQKPAEATMTLDLMVITIQTITSRTIL